MSFAVQGYKRSFKDPYRALPSGQFNMVFSQPVSIAIVGVGLIGPRHAQAVVGDPDAVLSCMVDPDPAAEEVAGRFDVPLFKSVREMFASDARPDAAIVCTPNHTHVAVSRQLLDGGVHVLVEKPISVDIPSGQELVHIAPSFASISLYRSSGAPSGATEVAGHTSFVRDADRSGCPPSSGFNVMLPSPLSSNKGWSGCPPQLQT